MYTRQRQWDVHKAKAVGCTQGKGSGEHLGLASLAEGHAVEALAVDKVMEAQPLELDDALDDVLIRQSARCLSARRPWNRPAKAVSYLQLPGALRGALDEGEVVVWPEQDLVAGELDAEVDVVMKGHVRVLVRVDLVVLHLVDHLRQHVAEKHLDPGLLGVVHDLANLLDRCRVQALDHPCSTTTSKGVSLLQNGSRCARKSSVSLARRN